MKPFATWLRALACCALLALPLGAQAHKASDAYGELSSAPDGAVALRLSLAVKDLDAAVDTLDADGDRRVTWGEVRNALPAVAAWVTQGLTVRCAGAPLAPAWAFESLERRSDGSYVRVVANLPCAAPQALTLDYRLMRELDATHRLLLSGQLDGHAVTAVLSPQGRGALALRPATPDTAGALPQSGPAVLAHFFPEGVHHIVTGYDHLAFLLALLLPIALRRDAASVPGTRSGVLALVTTVTGFTIGHSVTLALATLGWIASPAWVEPVIALTIAAAALLNLYPVRWIRGDVLALGFGLIHGLGFSNVMREAGVAGPSLPWALAGFNLGVEAGQLAGVALWCAAAWLLAGKPWYTPVVVRGGSWALAGVAAYWVVERVAFA